MRQTYKAMLAAAALAVSGCANASTADPHQHRMGPMADGQTDQPHMQCPMMMSMTPLVGCHGAPGDVEARLASMRAALQISPAQEGVWGAYAAAFGARAEGMGEGMMAMGASDETAAPPTVAERLRRHEAMMSQHLASIQALRAAIEPLYASFSAEQRAAADALHCEGRP